MNFHIAILMTSLQRRIQGYRRGGAQVRIRGESGRENSLPPHFRCGDRANVYLYDNWKRLQHRYPDCNYDVLANSGADLILRPGKVDSQFIVK